MDSAGSSNSQYSKQIVIMVNSKDKLAGKKIVVVGGSSGLVHRAVLFVVLDIIANALRIGNGAALALLEHGAHVSIISSSENRVNEVLKKINHPNLQGKVGDVRDENNYTEVLRSLAPVDHLIYSGVDKIIRGAIAEADLEDAKFYFGVKFWGSALTGKSKSMLAKPNIC